MMSTSVLIAVGAGTLACFLLPVCALLYWRRTARARLLPALWGALTFLLFAQGLEAVMHYFCLLSDNAVSRAILSSTPLYVLYGAFAAGIFEETGRYVMFKTVLRRDSRRESAVTAGIGHGGIEAVMVGGVSLLLYFITALLLQSGNTASAAALAGSEEGLQTVLAQLSSFTVGSCALAVLERAIAMLLHTSLSVFVFIAAKNREKRRYWPLAILLHAIFDIPAAMYQRGVITSLPLLELLLAVMALYAVRSARKRYLEMCDP